MIQYSYKHILRVQIITRYRFTYIAHSQTKSEYAYTTGTPGEPLSTVNYSYGNSDWKDLLTGYNGTAINYDLSGNPLNWRNASSLTWDGRRLTGMTLTDGSILAFEYNADGLRTSKTVGNSTVQYVWNDGNLVAEIRDGYTLKFLYNNGEAAGFSYNGADYYYGKDSFGVIRYLYNTSGEVVTTYTYDAWGSIVSQTGTLSSTVGEANPFRYRGYYLDSETGFCYVSSRYYDPEIGRWISPEPNIDYGEFDESAGQLAYNLFVYCANNPVKFIDDTGESITLACILIGAGIGLIAGGVFGAYRANKNGYTPDDGWKYWKYVVGYGVAGCAIGALVGWGAGTLIAKFGVSTAATSITNGGGAKFSSFNALKRSLGSAGKGKQWHHIVEQCQIWKSGFSKYWIQNSNNVINISNAVHAKISAYYSSIQSFTNGMTFRNWLAGQSFETQYEWGIKVLRMFGVKI